MTSPAERLLKAAEILEKRANEATEGPWILAKHKDGRILGIDAHDGYDEVIQGGPADCMAYCLGGTSTIEATDADWNYIATMHPEVGKAVAAWLRDEGSFAQRGLGYQRRAEEVADLVLASEQEQVER